MKIKHIYNACCIYIADNGETLLADPWLTPGAFEGSWFQYPPLRTTVDDIKDVSYLYLSHLHPDHFDVETLKQLPKQIPVVILKAEPSYLKNAVAKLGFEQIIEVADNESVKLGAFKLTLFKPFSKHPFDEASVNNLLDSAILVEADGQKVLNTNDNTPTLEAARSIRARYGAPDLFQVKDSLAGAYPSCFSQLSLDEKRAERKRLLDRQADHNKRLCDILGPSYVQPFASAYKLGGKLLEKNQTLGTMSETESILRMSFYGPDVVPLAEDEVLDLATGDVEFNSLYDSGQRSDQAHFWDEAAKLIKYPYEYAPEMSDGDLAPITEQASQRVLKKAKELGSTLNMRVDIVAHFKENCRLVDTFQIGTYDGKCTAFNMDARVLRNILYRYGHFNNYDIGAHITWERFPDPKHYEPDLTTLMCFYHY